MHFVGRAPREHRRRPRRSPRPPVNPARTAANTAVRSAQTVRPYEAFSTFAPVKIRPPSADRGADMEVRIGAIWPIGSPPAPRTRSSSIGSMSGMGRLIRSSALERTKTKTPGQSGLDGRGKVSSRSILTQPPSVSAHPWPGFRVRAGSVQAVYWMLPLNFTSWMSSPGSCSTKCQESSLATSFKKLES